jgi:uncharacterized membrane protein YkvA (DUF1232 family)
MKLIEPLKSKARKLKAEIQVLLIAYRDKRTPVAAKLLVGLTVGYLLSPIDLIPDFIPVLGLLDDLIIVPALISLSIKIIPPVVMADARRQLGSTVVKPRKNNWFFAALIVLLWLAILYFIGRWLNLY